MHLKKIEPNFDINYIQPEDEVQKTAYTLPPEVIKKEVKQNNNNESDGDIKEEQSPYDKLLEKKELSKKIVSTVFKYSKIFFFIMFILYIPLGIKTIRFSLYTF